MMQWLAKVFDQLHVLYETFWHFINTNEILAIVLIDKFEVLIIRYTNNQ